MDTVRRDSGITLRLPPTVGLAEPAEPVRRTRGGRRRPGASPPIPEDTHELRSEHDALLEALRGQDLVEVDSFRIEPTVEPTPASGRRSRAATRVAPRHPVEVWVPVGPGESAAVLLEQDGFYSWALPERVVEAAPARAGGRRTRAAAAATERRAEFRLDVRASAPARAASRSAFSSLLLRAAHAFVLRFVAPPVVGKVVSVLEQHVTTDLLRIPAPDPRTWKPVDPAASGPWPRNRPARILLLVHGTFSSTVGCYAALSLSRSGNALLTKALQRYDQVLAYDHRTLSLDPMENAADLLQRLRAHAGDRPVELDIVCHSRGGLVARSLIELVGPVAPWRPTTSRAVFVACTNRGTQLAAPENWRTLVDLYTNLAMAGSRALGLLPQTQLFGQVVNGVVQGVGVLVKALVEEAVIRQGVPGLAAMDPDGEFVTRINRTQPGQPDPLQSTYFVVSSNFEATGPGGPPAELPAQLVKMLADGLVDRLMHQAPNDLVVDDASMAAIDPAVGGFVDGTLDFGTNGSVYHTNYFGDDRFVAALAGWLELT